MTSDSRFLRLAPAKVALLLAMNLVGAWAEDTMPVELPPLVYVPSDKPGGEGGLLGVGVFIPYSGVAPLWDALGRHPPTPAPPTAILSAFSLSGSLQERTATLSCTGEATALKEGWSALELPHALALLSFTATDPRLTLERIGEALRLHLPSPGHYAFNATIAAPTTEDATGARSLELPLPETAVGSLDLLLPGRISEVQLQPACAHTLEAAGADTRLRAFLGMPAEVLRISWRPAVSSVGRPVLLLEEQVLAHASERSLREEVQAQVEVARDRVSDLVFQLPPTLQLLSVDGEDLRTWEVSDGQLHAHLTHALQGACKMRLSLEQALPALAVGAQRSVPLGVPALLGSERTTGSIAVFADGEVPIAITIDEQPGYIRVDPQRLGQDSAVAAVAFLAPPPALAIGIARRRPELDAVVDQLVRLGGDEDRIDLRIAVQVRQSGIYGVSCLLPQDWELVDAQASGVAIESSRLVADSAGMRRLNISFANLLQGSSQIQVQLRAPPSIPRGGTASVQLGVLPGIELSEARSEHGTLAVIGPRGWAISATTLEGLAGAEAQALAHDGPWTARLAQLDPDEVLALAYRWQRSDSDEGPRTLPQAKLEAAPRAREIDLRTEESVAVGDGDVHQVLDCRGEVRYSALPSLRLQAPSAWDDQLVIGGDGVAEHRLIGRDQGLSTWEVRFEQPVLGPLHLQIEHHLRLAGIADGQETTISIPTVQVLGATRQEHVVAVLRIGALDLQASDPGLSELLPGDVPTTLAGDGVVAAFQGAAAGALSIHLSRREDLRLADATIERAAYRAVLAEDGAVRVQGVLHLTDRGRPTLELRLPPHANLLEIDIDGQQGHPVSQSDGLIALPLPPGRGQSQLEIVLSYEQPGESPLRWFGRRALELPRLGDDQHARPLLIQEVSLSLFLPAAVQLMATRGDLAAGGQDRSEDPGDAVIVHIAGIGTPSCFGALGRTGPLQIWYGREVALWTVVILASLAGLLLALSLARRGAVAPACLALAGAIGLVLVATAWSFAAALPLLGLSAMALMVALVQAVRPWSWRRPVWRAEPPLTADDPWLAVPPAAATPAPDAGAMPPDASGQPPPPPAPPAAGPDAGPS